MKFENWACYNFLRAIQGSRNPFNSWERGDSYDKNGNDMADQICPDNIVIGANDLKLCQNLLKSAVKDHRDSHSKFLREILVSVDITAPLHWFKEFDTYKVGTTANSTSTMWKLASTPITRECFEFGDYDPEFRKDVEDAWNYQIGFLEFLRKKYNETKDIRYWKELIRLLPESWLQTRTWTANYQVLRNMYFDRRNHKLTEWSKDFVSWLETLPYAKELIMYEGD